MIKILLFMALALFAEPSVNGRFTPKTLAEIRVLPTDGAEAVQMVKAGTELEVRSILTDTLSREWYMVKIKNGTGGGFVLASELEPVDDGEKDTTLLKLKKEESADKKRRLSSVKNHPEWPRRIKSAVRQGALCLKMDSDQLIASWQEPYLRTTGFILGNGDVDIYFFRPENPVAVVLKNNEVIGWSEKEKKTKASPW